MTKPGRPRQGKNLKKPSDYPQYVFRLPQADKPRFEALLDEVVELLNGMREPGLAEESRSSVMARAVFRGLEDLKKRPGRA